MSKHNTTSLGSSLGATWALLLGFGILMLGDGLQGTLLAVRADQEGFSTTTTGFIMSSFYLGFLFGSILTPKVMARVGHIRVFAALAALASAAILIHAIFVEIPVWVALRLISGFCFAGLYVVAESWLNDRATNQSRGKLLSLYMVVTYMGVGIGQLFLNLADPLDYPLFVLSSVLISIAVVPLLLSASDSPSFLESVNIKLVELYKISPLGVVSMFIEGLVTATFFALGPIYGQRLGFNLSEISYFMAFSVVGVVLFQWPIGAFSDRFDRRLVLTITAFLASIAAYFCVQVSSESTSTVYLSAAIFAGLALPLYSVCIAHTNDNLKPNQMIAASGSLVLVGGIGAILGPIAVATSMDIFGNNAFFWCMGGAHTVTGTFALYRMTKRTAKPLDQQGSVTPTTMHSSSIAIESIQRYAVEEQTNEVANDET
jgi:MFS family permease